MFIEYNEKKNQCLFSKIFEHKGFTDTKKINEIEERLELILSNLSSKTQSNIILFALELIGIFRYYNAESYNENGFFCVSYIENKILIFIESVIKNIEKDNLSIVINEINECVFDKERLKLLYREKLTDFDINQRVSMGFLGIARRTQSKILFSFDFFNVDSSKFSVIISVSVHDEL